MVEWISISIGNRTRDRDISRTALNAVSVRCLERESRAGSSLEIRASQVDA